MAAGAVEAGGEDAGPVGAMLGGKRAGDEAGGGVDVVDDGQRISVLRFVERHGVDGVEDGGGEDFGVGAHGCASMILFTMLASLSGRWRRLRRRRWRWRGRGSLPGVLDGGGEAQVLAQADSEEGGKGGAGLVVVGIAAGNDGGGGGRQRFKAVVHIGRAAMIVDKLENVGGERSRRNQVGNAHWRTSKAAAMAPALMSTSPLAALNGCGLGAPSGPCCSKCASSHNPPSAAATTPCSTSM